MRLNVQTDYALRILMALAARPDVLQSVDQIARLHGISRNHLAKVAQELVSKGYVDAQRGRNGGMRLAKLAADITVGRVVRDIENDLGIVECLQHGSESRCALLPSCRLKTHLSIASRMFLEHLDTVTLRDLLERAPA